MVANVTFAEARRAAERAQRAGRPVPALYAAILAAEGEKQARLARLRQRYQPHRHTR